MSDVDPLSEDTIDTTANPREVGLRLCMWARPDSPWTQLFASAAARMSRGVAYGMREQAMGAQSSRREQTQPSSTMATATVSTPNDVLLEALVYAPRPFPLQPHPLMTPIEHTSSLSFATICDKRVACFNSAGEPRLCFPQVISGCLQGFELTEITSVIADLQIFVQTASLRQIEALKLSKALPDDAITCGLIKKSDAERVIGEMKFKVNGHMAPFGLNVAERLLVQHDCFGLSMGYLYPSLYPRPCIQCTHCLLLFTPEHFTVHNHEHKQIIRMHHWGFDSANWRMYIRVSKEQPDYENAEKVLEEFKNPTVKKRSCSMSEDPEIFAKRSIDQQILARQLRSEDKRREELLLQLNHLSSQLGQHHQVLNTLSLPLDVDKLKFDVSALAAKTAASVPSSSCDTSTVVVDCSSDLIKPKATRPDSGQSEESAEEDTLDSTLAMCLQEPELSLVRNKIADSQRAILQQLEEVVLDRDNLRTENGSLKQQNSTLLAYIQCILPQIQQHQQHQQHQQKLAAAAASNPLQQQMIAAILSNMNNMSASSASAVAAATLKAQHLPTANVLGNSVFGLAPGMMQLLQQQQQLAAVQAQMAAASSSSASASMHPSLSMNALAALNLLSPSKAASLPTASQLDSSPQQTQ